MADKNKNNYLWIGIAVVAVIVIAIIFISNSNRQSQNEVTCNSPYIKVGNECCLDENSNNICDKDETLTTTIQEPSEVKKLSTDEIKSIVYQAIRKYIPKSTIGNFEYNPLPSNTRCYERWFYPSNEEDASKNVVASIIQNCKIESDTYTPEEQLSLCSNCLPSENYIKTLENGKVLIHDKKWGDISRDDYEIDFACGTFWIRIVTQDFYGDNAWPIYEDYNIDKIAMENMVNEILTYCS